MRLSSPILLRSTPRQLRSLRRSVTTFSTLTRYQRHHDSSRQHPVSRTTKHSSFNSSNTTRELSFSQLHGHRWIKQLRNLRITRFSPKHHHRPPCSTQCALCLAVLEFLRLLHHKMNRAPSKRTTMIEVRTSMMAVILSNKFTSTKTTHPIAVYTSRMTPDHQWVGLATCMVRSTNQQTSKRLKTLSARVCAFCRTHQDKSSLRLWTQEPMAQCDYLSDSTPQQHKSASGLTVLSLSNLVQRQQNRRGMLSRKAFGI